MVPLECRLESPAAYASFLTTARPNVRLGLMFRWSIAFRTRQQAGQVPPPRLSIERYLRKWNTFADVLMPGEPLLEYSEKSLRWSMRSCVRHLCS